MTGRMPIRSGTAAVDVYGGKDGPTLLEYTLAPTGLRCRHGAEATDSRRREGRAEPEVKAHDPAARALIDGSPLARSPTHCHAHRAEALDRGQHHVAWTDRTY